MMELDAGACRLRPFDAADRHRLAEVANDKRIWRNLTDRFPHPYRLDDADTWIQHCADEGLPVRNFAIEAGGLLVGGMGVEMMTGEKRHVGGVGYWLGVDYWGQGLASTALEVFTHYVLDQFAVDRLQAQVAAWNPASARVLEKCGYVLEGRLIGAFAKDGEVTDELLYGLCRER